MRRKKEYHSCERTDLGSQVSAISWLPLIDYTIYDHCRSTQASIVTVKYNYYSVY